MVKGLLRYYINHDGEEKTHAFSQENDYVCNYGQFCAIIQKQMIMTTKISYTIAFLLGLGMIFLGTRFFIS